MEAILFTIVQTVVKQLTTLFSAEIIASHSSAPCVLPYISIYTDICKHTHIQRLHKLLFSCGLMLGVCCQFQLWSTNMCKDVAGVYFTVCDTFIIYTQNHNEVAL